jgi:hypothetical protein
VPTVKVGGAACRDRGTHVCAARMPICRVFKGKARVARSYGPIAGFFGPPQVATFSDGRTRSGQGRQCRGRSVSGHAKASPAKGRRQASASTLPWGQAGTDQIAVAGSEGWGACGRIRSWALLAHQRYIPATFFRNDNFSKQPMRELRRISTVPCNILKRNIRSSRVRHVVPTTISGLKRLT